MLANNGIIRVIATSLLVLKVVSPETNGLLAFRI